MAIQSRGSNFVAVTCRCGRSLRAKPEQIGTEIRCWDCHQPLLVPMPRGRLHVGRELGDGFAVATRGRSLAGIVAGSVVVTSGLLIPGMGLAVGGVLFLLMATAYGPLIGRAVAVAEEPRPAWRTAMIPGMIVRGCLGAAMAAGIYYPLWLRNAAGPQTPYLDRVGLAILLATLVILPIANLMASGDGRRGMLGPGKALRLMLRFPLPTIATLAIVPACLVALEIGLTSLFYLQGTFAYFTLDFMPMIEKPVAYQGVPYFRSIDFRSYPGLKFVPNYLLGLRRGLSFIGVFPPSLSIDNRAGYSSSALYMPERAYWGVRGCVTLVILVILLTAAAIQARWLGVITALEKKRPS